MTVGEFLEQLDVAAEPRLLEAFGTEVQGNRERYAADADADADYWFLELFIFAVRWDADDGAGSSLRA